jgi:hypothetical protein
VYEGELVETGTSPGLVGAADEPGFFAVPDGAEANLPYGDTLPGNAATSLDFLLAPFSPVPGASILFWDGTGGSVMWSAVPNFEYFDILGNGGSGGILNGSNSLLGVTLDDTGLDGSLHSHPEFFLYGDGGTADPTFGFYALFGRTNVDGLASSHPWAVVFDFGVEDEVLHEMAVEDVVSFIPEPTTGSLLALGLLGLALNGRRRAAA